MNAKSSYNLSTYVDMDNISAGKEKQIKKEIKFSKNISINTKKFENNDDKNYEYNYNIENILNDIDSLDFTPKNVIFCFFRVVNNKNRTDIQSTFLQYLLYKYPESKKETSNSLVFPFIKFNSKKSLKETISLYTKKIFGTSLKTMGFLEQDKNIYLFFNINTIFKNIKRILYLDKTTDFWWGIIDEICNHKRILYYSIHQSVYKIFYNNPKLIYIKDQDNKSIEIPTVAYRGFNFEDINKILILKNEGGHFINNETVFNLQHFYSLDYSFKRAVTNYYNDHENFLKNKKDGGIIRYVLFLGDLGKTKVFINRDIKDVINNINKHFNKDDANSIVLTNASFNKKPYNTYIEYFLQSKEYYSLSFHKVDLKDKCPIWEKDEKYNLV